MSAKRRFRIPGVTFSWKRALGITSLKRKRERLWYNLCFGKLR